MLATGGLQKAAERPRSGETPPNWLKSHLFLLLRRLKGSSVNALAKEGRFGRRWQEHSHLA